MLQQDLSQLGHTQLPAVARCKERNRTKGTSARGLGQLGAGTLSPRVASRAHPGQWGDPGHRGGLGGPRCPWGAWAKTRLPVHPRGTSRAAGGRRQQEALSASAPGRLAPCFF